jgi:hypothetical protein
VVMAYWKGAEGVAIACLIRVSLDTLAVSAIAHFIMPLVVPLWRRTIWVFAAAFLVFAAGALFGNSTITFFFIFTVIGAFEIAAWKLLLQAEDREAVVRLAAGARERAVGVLRFRPAPL